MLGAEARTGKQQMLEQLPALLDRVEQEGTALGA